LAFISDPSSCFKYIPAPLSTEQLAALVQVPR
jgi:hypothetical protein